ncbi:unnamed protein product [Brugia timori]|uniref:C2H2-type domain-containing protein n=1 Tax=Brugia timori TaxID=42155 RepID=A0A0R3QW07_9BILA|nr:unnamed protein product [Brugia timori]
MIMSLSSKAPNEGIICGSCGLILKHVEALRAHRAEFHPRQVIQFGECPLKNISSSSSRDVPPSSDGSTVGFSKLMMHAIKKEDSGSNRKVFVENQINTFLGCFDRFELCEYILGAEKTVEKLAVYGAASSNSIEEQKLSVPSDLISMLSTLFILLLYHKHFILRRIPPASSDLTGASEKSN